MEKARNENHKKRKNTPENHLTRLLKRGIQEAKLVAQIFTILKDDPKHRSEHNDHRQRNTGTISNRTR